jgi:hypothetical protein
MKTFVLTFLLLIGSIQVFAGKPPEAVAKAFKQKFPSAVNIKWVKERGNYWEVSFNLKDKKVFAEFTADGHWLRSNMKISITELRDEVKSGVKFYYPSCEIISIEMIESVSAGTYYEIEVKCGDKNYKEIYDSNGYRIRI